MDFYFFLMTTHNILILNVLQLIQTHIITQYACKFVVEIHKKTIWFLLKKIKHIVPIVNVFELINCFNSKYR